MRTPVVDVEIPDLEGEQYADAVMQLEAMGLVVTLEGDYWFELGQGSPPIRGRETLMGMASRLQPRTAAFVLEFDDVNVEFADPDQGEVTFTALFRRRSQASGEESIDAREFAGEVVRSAGRWRVSKVTAIDTLR